jgi:hypothetical protein
MNLQCFVALMMMMMMMMMMQAVRTPIVLGGTLLYIMFFAIGSGPIPFILIPEIAPERIRGTVIGHAPRFFSSLWW